MKARNLLAIIVFAVSIRAAYHWPRPKPDQDAYRNQLNSIRSLYEPIYQTIDSQNTARNSLQSKQYDTIYKTVYKKVETIKYLPIDSVYKLWAELDSEYRQNPDRFTAPDGE